MQSKSIFVAALVYLRILYFHLVQNFFRHLKFVHDDDDDDEDFFTYRQKYTSISALYLLQQNSLKIQKHE